MPSTTEYAQTVTAVVDSLSKNKYVTQVLSPLSPQGANDITKDGKEDEGIHWRTLVAVLRLPCFART